MEDRERERESRFAARTVGLERCMGVGRAAVLGLSVGRCDVCSKEALIEEGGFQGCGGRVRAEPIWLEVPYLLVFLDTMGFIWLVKRSRGGGGGDLEVQRVTS